MRQVAISRRLPRGLTAVNPLDGTQEEFGLGREFILNNRHIFKYSYNASSVPLLAFAQDWSKEYDSVEAIDDVGRETIRSGEAVFGTVTSTYPEVSELLLWGMAGVIG